MTHHLRLLPLLLVSSWASAAHSSWSPLEVRLTAHPAVADPYSAEPVAIRWTGPAGGFTSLAFSDDGVVFQARTALPAGAWRWEVTAAPEGHGLAGRRGTLAVTDEHPGHPLRAAGFLRVAGSGTHLEQSDGTPFLWLGDTAWNAAWFAQPTDWNEYLHRRAQQGFNVVLVHATNSKSVTETRTPDGREPFRSGRPDPAYWAEFDARVAMANERGLVALVVGVGRSSSRELVEETTDPRFARYLASRLGGHFVVFSPSMDIGYDPRNDVAAREIRRAAPRHLITQHVGTDLPAALAYAAADTIDFASLQSGHARGNLARTRQHVLDWLPAVIARAGRRPVLNLEAMYDEHGPAEGATHRRIDARQLSWLSWLSGSAGVTYGVDGVWRWTQSPAERSWRTCLDWESAADHTRLRAFQSSMPWWTLSPAPGALVDPPTDPLLRPALAASGDRSVVVAWMPAGSEIRIDPAFLPEDPLPVWYDPTTGERTIGAAPEPGHDAVRLVAPSPGEWAVEIRPRSHFRPHVPKPGEDLGGGPRTVPAPPTADAYVVAVDGWRGDEAGARPREDRHHGTDGDVAAFRRHNVSRAHDGGGLGYWYTSRHRLAGEASTTAEQWVDYIGPQKSGWYRVRWTFRTSENRAAYPARVLIHHRVGVAVLEVPQEGLPKGRREVDLGLHEFSPGGFVRVSDPGPGSISFGPMAFVPESPPAQVPAR